MAVLGWIKNSQIRFEGICKMNDKEKIDFLLKVIKAQDALLMCYKLGGQPSEHTLNIMAKFRKYISTKSEPQ